MNTLYRKQIVTLLLTSDQNIKNTTFPGQHHFIETYSKWVVLDRSTQIVVATVLSCGVLLHAGSLLLPYLVWTPAQVLLNLAMMAAVVNLEDKTCVAIALLVCLDTYCWGVVYSGRQQMVLDDILDEKYDRNQNSLLDADGRSRRRGRIAKEINKIIRNIN